MALESPYANIKSIRLRLPELQDKDKEVKALRAAGLPEDWKNVEGVLQYQGLLYILEIICSKVINCHHNNSFTGYFGIDKTRELICRKYYWLSLRNDVENYVRECDVCLASKAACHKPYRDL